MPAVSALGIALPAAPAVAQQVDVPPLLPVEKPPITRRYTAVTERSQPGYETSGFDLGAFTLQPQLRVTTTYDDNIYVEPSGARGDVFVRSQPEVTLSSKGQRNKVTLNARGTIDRYRKRTTENAETYLVTGYGLYGISHATQLEVAARAESGVQSRLAEDVAAQTVRPIRYRRQSGVAKLTQTYGHLKIEGTGLLVNTDFSDGRLPDGSVYEQRTVSNLGKQGRLRAILMPTPSIGMFVQGLYENRSFRFSSPDTPKRNSDSYQVLAGLVFEPKALMRGTIGIGYVRQNFRDPYYTDIGGFSFNGKLQFFPTQLTTITLNGDRSVKDSGIPRSGGYLSTTGSIGIDHELLRQLVLNASFEIQRNQFNNLDRHDIRTAVNGGATYRLNRYAQINLSYQRIDQRSRGIDRYRPYVDDRASIGLTLRR